MTKKIHLVLLAHEAHPLWAELVLRGSANRKSVHIWQIFPDAPLKLRHGAWHTHGYLKLAGFPFPKKMGRDHEDYFHSLEPLGCKDIFPYFSSHPFKVPKRRRIDWCNTVFTVVPFEQYYNDNFANKTSPAPIRPPSVINSSPTEVTPPQNSSSEFGDSHITQTLFLPSNYSTDSSPPPISPIKDTLKNTPTTLINSQNSSFINSEKKTECYI